MTKIEQLCIEYQRATNAAAAYKAKADALKAEILLAVADTGRDTYETPLCKVRSATFPRVSLDTKKLKAERPEIYAEYSKTTISTRDTISAVIPVEETA